MSVPATPENIAAAIADPKAPLPVGARRMTNAERQTHVSQVLSALFKGSTVRRHHHSTYSCISPLSSLPHVFVILKKEKIGGGGGGAACSHIRLFAHTARSRCSNRPPADGDDIVDK